MLQQPPLLSYKKCKCNWGGDKCAQTQETIAKYCFETGQSHPCLGYLRITKKHVHVRASVWKHLGNGFKTNVDNYFIARHHFHPHLMTLYGNKTMTVQFGDVGIVIPELKGRPYWKQADKLMTREEASQVGIHHASEFVTDEKGKSGYVFAPVAPWSDVKMMLDGFTSSRNSRRQARASDALLDTGVSLSKKNPRNGFPLPEEVEGVKLDDDPQLPSNFDPTNAATWVVPPQSLASIISCEASRYSSISDDGTITLDSSDMQLRLLHSALFLYTRYFGHYMCIPVVPHEAVTATSQQQQPVKKTFYLRPCSSPVHKDCSSFQILKMQVFQQGPCNLCRDELLRQQKVLDRSNQACEKSKYKNNRYCSEEELKVKVEQTTSAKNVKSKLALRAKSRLEQSRHAHSMMIDSKDSELKSLFGLAVKYVEQNKVDATEALMKAVLEQMVTKKKQKTKKDTADSDTEKRMDEAKVLVTEIIEGITNWSQSTCKGSRSVHYSARTMRIALSLFMADKKGYEIWKKSKIEPYPSVSYLKKLKLKMTPKEGTFPMIFAWFQDACRKCGWTAEKLMGQILCDRLKLRSEFYFNPSTLCAKGVVISDNSDRIDLADEVSKLFTEPSQNEQLSNENDLSCSIYVNQFRLRTIDNVTCTGPFYFDNGSVSGDEILRQIKEVIIGFEMVGARILGLAMDGGGENMRGVKLARDGNDPSGGDHWLQEEQCSFVNPADPSRRVSIVLCSTHDAKAGRNQLLTSGPRSGPYEYKKDFKFEGVKFGWRTIQDCYERDRQRDVSQTPLTRESAMPDQWNKMSAKLVKHTFNPDTLEDILSHIWSTIESVGNNCEFLWCKQDDSLTAGERILAHLPRLKRLLRDMLQPRDIDKDLKMKLDMALSDVYCLEYLSHMSVIYVDNLMHSKKRISPKNIDDVEKKLKNTLSYFGKWYEDCQLAKKELHKKEPKSLEWQKWFISPQSYLNWRTGICGFLLYCRYTWKSQEVDNRSQMNYIPMLHSNTSMLEAYFSLVRANKGDTPLKYPGMVGTLDSRNQMMALESNPMYEGDNQVSQSPTKSMDAFFMRTDRLRNATVKEWLSMARESKRREA